MSDRSDRREKEWEKRESDRVNRIATNRARRGTPQRFTLRGPQFFGPSGDRSMSLESIDPPLETDEVIEVIRVDDLNDNNLQLTKIHPDHPLHSSKRIKRGEDK